MRLRNIKGSKEAIATSEFVIQDPEKLKGKWHEFFGNNNPIYIEIGMGKGQLLAKLASDNPNINYIGIEKYSSVLIRAIERRSELELDNLFFIRFDADYITDIFSKAEVSRIYLNFSDPWPKERHAKRRLTSKQFLEKYNQILIAEGDLIFKTDNKQLFEFSLEQLEIKKWKLKNISYDLHNSPYAEGNVMTEYEEKFSSLGYPIYRLVAYR